MQDERIRRERPFLARQRRGELVLHDHGVVGIGNTDPIGHPQNVPIDRQTGYAERMPEDDVRGFSSDAGQSNERLHLRRHFASVALDESGSHPGERLRFGSKEAGRLDLRLELGDRRLRESASVGIASEQRRRDAVDALVGALR